LENVAKRLESYKVLVPEDLETVLVTTTTIAAVSRTILTSITRATCNSLLNNKS